MAGKIIHTESDLLEDLQRVAVILGKTPNSRDYSKLGKHSVNTLARRFGSFKNAWKKAKLESPIHKTKYTFDRDCFKSPLSPEAAYVLGLISADGCIIKRKGIESCAFRQEHVHSDIVLIEYIKSVLKSTHPIYEYEYSTRGKSAIISIYSKSLVKDLEHWGIKQHKTGNHAFPSNLPKELISHYIRGYFDGDGSLMIHKQKKNRDKPVLYEYLKVKIVGTHEFCEGLSEYLGQQGIFRGTLSQTKESPGLWYLSWLGSSAHNLCAFMYEGEGFSLERKREIWENFQAIQSKKDEL